MSTFGTKNLMSVFVGKDVAGTAIASITSDLAATMADGQIIAVGTPSTSQAGTGFSEIVIPASSALGSFTSFRLVELQNGLLNYGPKINVKDVVGVTLREYVAPAEQTWSIGYNGSSGSLDVSQGNEFILTIAYDHDDILWSEQKLRNSYDYYSAAPTQQGLAASMVSQINYKETLGALNGTGRMVRAEMLSDGTAATATDGTDVQDAIVTLDSTSVKLVDTGTSTAGNLAGCQTSLPVGTVINLAGVKYIVQSIATVGSDTILTLNTPYQGSSATLTGGTTIASQFAKMSAITSYGIRVKGQALTWQKDFFKFNKVKFHFDLKNFGTSAINKTAESSKGSGSSYEVAEYESFAAGFDGILNRMKVPLPVGRTYADTTTPKTYSTLVFESADNTVGALNVIEGSNPMRVQQYVFIPASATQRTKLGTQLNTLLGLGSLIS